LFGAFGGDKVESITGMDFVTGLLGNTTVLSKAQSWISISIIFLFTLLVFRNVQKTRRDAKAAIIAQYIDLAKYKDHECLKTRTLHLEGVLPYDSSGMAIEKHLNDILKKRA
jgi:hypothetical protein